MIDRRLACLGLATGLLARADAPLCAEELNRDQYAGAIKQRLDKAADEQKLRDHKLYGMTLISFRIDAAGKLKWRRVIQGDKGELDQLALRVVDAAAPFPPLPPALRDHVWVWLCRSTPG